MHREHQDSSHDTKPYGPISDLIRASDRCTAAARAFFVSPEWRLCCQFARGCAPTLRRSAVPCSSRNACDSAATPTSGVFRDRYIELYCRAYDEAGLPYDVHDHDIMSTAVSEAPRRDDRTTATRPVGRIGRRRGAARPCQAR